MSALEPQPTKFEVAQSENTQPVQRHGDMMKFEIILYDYYFCAANRIRNILYRYTVRTCTLNSSVTRSLSFRSDIIYQSAFELLIGFVAWNGVLAVKGSGAQYRYVVL